jgi:hypothetical protein
MFENLSFPVVTPQDEEYTRSTFVRNTNAKYVLPDAIFYCSQTEHVIEAINFLVSNNIDFVIRSGGHSYEATSMTKTPNSVVLDVSQMKDIHIDKETATFGPGCLLVDVYEALFDKDLLLPSATNFSVAISGVTLGGGQGLFCRKYGMTCDSLLSLDIVLSDGSLVHASKEHNSDLFWAHQGAGAANFGVVVGLTFQVYPVPPIVTTFVVQYVEEINNLEKIFSIWESMTISAPDEISMQFSVEAESITVMGLYMGREKDIQQHIAPLLVGDHIVQTQSMSCARGLLAFSGFHSFEHARCSILSENTSAEFKVKSSYSSVPLDERAYSAIRRILSATSIHASIAFMAMGGTVNRVKCNETSFYHRNNLFLMQLSVSWVDQTKDLALLLCDRFYEKFIECTGVFAYPNCPDDDLSTPTFRFFGENQAKLKTIKDKYDQLNVFKHGTFEI